MAGSVGRPGPRRAGAVAGLTRPAPGLREASDQPTPKTRPLRYGRREGGRHGPLSVRRKQRAIVYRRAATPAQLPFLLEQLAVCSAYITERGWSLNRTTGIVDDFGPPSRDLGSPG